MREGVAVPGEATSDEMVLGRVWISNESEEVGVRSREHSKSQPGAGDEERALENITGRGRESR
jgi:hypothetical protein